MRTREVSEAKTRLATVAAFMETVWQGPRATEAGVSLTHRQAVALAGELYRTWASGAGRERTTALLHTPQGWVRDDSPLSPEEEAVFPVVSERLEAARAAGDEADLEPTLGPIVSRLLLARGIAEVDAPSRTMLLVAFAGALRDAFLSRARNAAEDYSPDPKSQRFPEWRPPESKPEPVPPPALAAGKVSLKGLVESWWTEAKAAGLKPSTYESYRNTMRRFTAYLMGLYGLR